jgi:cyclic pyranopterin phosphate synthase
MVDVGAKDIQRRIARASGSIQLEPATITLLKDNQMKKGDVLAVAQIAGISGAKQTGTLIPLCHNIVLDKVALNLSLTETSVIAESEVICTGRTGVEMEALTAVSIALLTIYDMCKAVDKKMVIGDITLKEKIKI